MNEITPPRVYAVIPAAGRSRRMGADKLLLEYAGQPMLLGLLQTLEKSRVASVCLVTRAAIAERLDLSSLSKILVAYNENPAAEMIDSIRIGLDQHMLNNAPADGDAFLVCPADHPGVAVEDFDACIETFHENSGRIIIAERAGRRGHPLIFPVALLGQVKSAVCESGLNALARNRPELVVAAPCRSPGVTRDMDTPEDYRSLKNPPPE